MKKIIFGIVNFSLLFGYYGKVEPLNTFTIKSSVSGKVIESNLSAQGKYYNGIVIKIDDYQNRLDLNNSLIQLHNLKKIESSQIEIVKRKKNIYEIYTKLKTKSQFDKDNKFFDYQNSVIALNQTKNNIANLETQILKLKDIIAKKHIKLKNYIYSINVQNGDYVNISTPLATTMQINKVKIDIFVPIEKIEEIKNKKIYINNKLSNFKIDKIYKVADTKFVTSYKVEIIGKYPKISDIVKVEFK